jgi:hypothetical protein
MEGMMLNEKQSNFDPDRLMQQLDDMDAELETQSDHLTHIKYLLIGLLVLLLPVAALAVIGMWFMLNPRLF